MEQEPRPFPSNEEEVKLLKQTFKGNENLLKKMRGLFFGFDLTKEEKDSIRSIFADKHLREAVRKKIYPLLSNDAPIGSVADYWMGTEATVFGGHRDQITQSISSKEKVFEFLTRAISLLENPDQPKIDLVYNPQADDDLKTGLLARNLYIRSIETGLNFIKMVADIENKTEKQVKDIMKKNSVK